MKKYTYETSNGEKIHSLLHHEEIIPIYKQSTRHHGEVSIDAGKLIPLMSGNDEERKNKLAELTGRAAKDLPNNYGEKVYLKRQLLDDLYSAANALEERMREEESLPEQPAADTTPPTTATKPNFDEIVRSTTKSGRPPNLGKR